MDLGKRLKAKRKEKNISAEYLAKELGISVSTVYRYEDSSILKIPVSTFEKMCDILGTTPAQMMGNISEKTVETQLYRALRFIKQKLSDDTNLAILMLLMIKGC